MKRSIFYIFLFIALHANLVLAQNTQIQTPAEQLIEQAMRSYSAQNYQEALSGFISAYEMTHDPLLLEKIGRCYFMLEQYDKTVEFFQRYLNDVQLTTEQRRSAMEFLTDAHSRYSLLYLQINPQTDCILTINGINESVCLSDHPYVLKRGSYVIRITGQGYENFERTVESAGNRDIRLEVNLRPIPVKNQNQTTIQSNKLPSYYFWSSVGLTGVFLLGTIITGSLSLDARDEYRQIAGIESLSEQQDKYDYMNNLATAADVLLGFTIAAGAASVLLAFFTDFSFGSQTVSFSPVIGPDNNGFTLSLSY